MKANLFLILLIGLFFVSCKDQTIEPAITLDEIEENPDANNYGNNDPVTSCDETLSAYELKDAWEMMNAKIYNQKNVCFEGYVLSNQTYGDLVQGTIAFKPISEGEVDIPSVFCQFTGINGANFLDYEVGDKISIMGRLLTIDNPDKHNFMFVKCSLAAK